MVDVMRKVGVVVNLETQRGGRKIFCRKRMIRGGGVRADSFLYDRARRVDAARVVLDGYIRELADQMGRGCSENLKRHLECCARFHQYSFGNLVLALSQCPTMTRIAGIKTWNRLGRRVRAGQRGIMILAPIRIVRQQDKKCNQADGSDLSDSGAHSFMVF